MLAVIIIAVLFTAIAVGVAVVATRGGLGGVSAAVQTQTRSGSRMVNSVLAIVYLAFGIAVPLVFIIGEHNSSTAQVGTIKLTAAEQTGRVLFAEHCATCHTLAAASAVGKTGPNLDSLKPKQALILSTLAHGCAQNPIGASSAASCIGGYGNMPADIVTGRDAQDVAAFVAKVAGHG